MTAEFVRVFPPVFLISWQIKGAYVSKFKIRFTDLIQDNWQVLRPVVLFAETISKRSRHAGIDRPVVGEIARRFIEQGMPGLQNQWNESFGQRYN
jgi:hypothetical protein